MANTEVTWETAAEVERRYGIPAWILNKCLKARRGLFWARNPYTNKMMVCGEMPPEERQQWEDYVKRVREGKDGGTEKGNWNPFSFLWYGPTSYCELVIWLMLLPLTLLLLMVRGIMWVSNEIESVSRDVGCCKNYDSYAGGDGLFDAVNDMRRTDIEYLFGGARK